MLITNLNILKSYRNALKSGVTLLLQLKHKHVLIRSYAGWENL